MERISTFIPPQPSILHKLKSSIDQVRCIRKKGSDSPKKLEIKMSSSYILKDRALGFSSLLKVIPESQEERTERREKSASHPSKKIEFFRLEQHKGSSSSSVSENFSPENPVSNKSPTVNMTDVNEAVRERFGLKNKSTQAKIPPIKTPVAYKPKPLPNKPSPIKSTGDHFFSSEATQKPSQTHSLLISKARSEISALRQTKQLLQQKLLQLEDSLNTLNSLPPQETFSSIELKLSKLESQQLIPEEDSRLPIAISKVANLESQIIQLKSLKDSSIFQYEEELKDVYHKLKDLKECNEILNEMVTCFRKEPIVLDKDMRNEGMINENEIMESIKRDGMAGYESILQEAYEKKEELLRAKDQLEGEHKVIANQRSNLLSKNRKLELEYELSLIHSQLSTINSKIKRYTSENLS